MANNKKQQLSRNKNGAIKMKNQQYDDVIRESYESLLAIFEKNDMSEEEIVNVMVVLTSTAMNAVGVKSVETIFGRLSLTGSRDIDARH